MPAPANYGAWRWVQFMRNVLEVNRRSTDVDNVIAEITSLGQVI